MTQLNLGDVSIDVMFKDIKNLHLSVNPPSGNVRISAPSRMNIDSVRLFAISKLAWIKQQRKKQISQQRETGREFIDRESHYLWGRRYLLTVIEQDAKPSVRLNHRKILLSVRPGSDCLKRAEVMHEWHKSLLHGLVPDLIARWELNLGVKIDNYFLQRMKTKWGSCNHFAKNIRINTELVKKPKNLLEYVVVHEMAHLLEPTHSDNFVAILEKHYPTWREARAELNELPLSADLWKHR